jgi:hypothetical protein
LPYLQLSTSKLKYNLDKVKIMKLTSKTISIALLSLLTSVTAINSNVRAENIQVKYLPVPASLDCNAIFVKEFTQMPVIKNTTNQTIAAGKVVSWRAYWAGKPSGSKHNLTLSQALAPGQSIDTGVQLSGDQNSCKAYY